MELSEFSGRIPGRPWSFSGGVDSAYLLGRPASTGADIRPIM